jgi:DNA-binding CsgD family transcriptional regulator
VVDSGREEDMPLEKYGGCVNLTRAEAEVLALVATGLTDAEAAEELTLTVAAVRAGLRRFHARSGMAGRSGVVWARDHFECCIDPAFPRKVG